jgi:hypothetical protein
VEANNFIRQTTAFKRKAAVQKASFHGSWTSAYGKEWSIHHHHPPGILNLGSVVELPVVTVGMAINILTTMKHAEDAGS